MSILFLIVGWVCLIRDTVWRFIVFPYNWWKKQELKHIKKTVNINNVQAMSCLDKYIPYVSISFDVQNNSEYSIDLGDIRLSLCMEEWNLGSVTVHDGRKLV